MEPGLRSPPETYDRTPGCGLAAYATMLLVFGIGGTIALFAASLSLLTAREGGPSPMLSKGEIAVWQLKPMRQARVIDLTEVPSAWHDESGSFDGSVACGLMTDRLVRVEGEQGWTLPYANLEAVSGVGDEYDEGVTVTATGAGVDGAPVQITCAFRAEEGGVRMLRQLQSELEKAAATRP